MKKTLYLRVKHNGRDTYGRVFGVIGYDPVLLIPVEFDGDEITNIADVLTIVTSRSDSLTIEDKLYNVTVKPDTLPVTAVLNNNTYALHRNSEAIVYATVPTRDCLTPSKKQLPILLQSKKVASILENYVKILKEGDICDNTLLRLKYALQHAI